MTYTINTTAYDSTKDAKNQVSKATGIPTSKMNAYNVGQTQIDGVWMTTVQVDINK